MSLVDVSVLREPCVKQLLPLLFHGNLKDETKGIMMILLNGRIVDKYEETPLSAAQEIQRRLPRHKIIFYGPDNNYE